jgi:hypothetical protein
MKFKSKKKNLVAFLGCLLAGGWLAKKVRE